jgi:hypothetical protein
MEKKKTRVWIPTEVSFSSITEQKECQIDKRLLAEKSQVGVKVIKYGAERQENTGRRLQLAPLH